MEKMTGDHHVPPAPNKPVDARAEVLGFDVWSLTNDAVESAKQMAAAEPSADEQASKRAQAA